jgi:hypothetical protein
MGRKPCEANSGNVLLIFTDIIQKIVGKTTKVIISICPIAAVDYGIHWIIYIISY